MSVDGWIGADVSQIESLGEDGFHGTGAGIENEPFDFDIRPESLLEPAIARACQAMSDNGLGVSDIGEMTDADGIGLSSGSGEGESENGSKGEAKNRRASVNANYHE